MMDGEYAFVDGVLLNEEESRVYFEGYDFFCEDGGMAEFVNPYSGRLGSLWEAGYDQASLDS